MPEWLTGRSARYSSQTQIELHGDFLTIASFCSYSLVFAVLSLAPELISAEKPAVDFSAPKAIPSAPEPIATADTFATTGSSSSLDFTSAEPAGPEPAAGAFAAPFTPGGTDTSRYAKYIEPGQKAQQLKWTGKMIVSGWEQLQPWSFETQFISAEWEQIIQSNPKNGSNLAALGGKLWIANVRQNSQAIFADGVFAGIYHQDDRYYTLGKGGFLRRLYYSASRVLITRGDNGKPQFNYSQVSGYGVAQFLTRFYYPASGCTWGAVGQGYAVSLGGAALGNALHEFGKELFSPLQHKHKDQ